MYFVYILQSEVNGRYYIGSTADVSARLFRHNAGHNISTKAFRPWKSVYVESFITLVEARRREQQIKAWKNTAFMAKTLGLGT